MKKQPNPLINLRNMKQPPLINQRNMNLPPLINQRNIQQPPLINPQNTKQNLLQNMKNQPIPQKNMFTPPQSTMRDKQLNPNTKNPNLSKNTYRKVLMPLNQNLTTKLKSLMYHLN